MSIKRFRTNSLKEAPERIDRVNRIIYGVSCNTEGPALGHGVELEREFVEDVTNLGNKAPKGIRGRFGHPGMSTEALGTFLGRYQNFRNIERAGKLRSIADFQIDPSTKSAPGGDRGEHILDLAESSPDMFATSIVFKGWEYKKDAEGNKIFRPKREDFESYQEWDRADDDYIAIKSKKYASIEALEACDFVDQPAANPDGLFSEDTFAGIAGKFLSEHPAVNEMLKNNPDILTELSNDEHFDSFFDAYPQIKDLIDSKPEAAKSFLGKYNKLPNSDDEAGEEETLNYDEFKEKYPDFYQKAFAEGETSGISKENKRASAHLLLGKENDALDIACLGIADGSGIDDTYTAKYIQAGINKNALTARHADETDTDVGDLPSSQLSEQDVKKKAAFEKIMAKRRGE